MGRFQSRRYPPDPAVEDWNVIGIQSYAGQTADRRPADSGTGSAGADTALSSFAAHEAPLPDATFVPPIYFLPPHPYRPLPASFIPPHDGGGHRQRYGSLL